MFLLTIPIFLSKLKVLKKRQGRYMIGILGAFPYMIRYIDFYLDTIATSENISLLYYLTMRVKMVRDAISEFSKVK